MKRFAFVLAGLALSGGLAVAQTPEKAAETAFNNGNTAYNLGRFEEAAGHFTKAYEAMPLPEFLYNIAQSYRLGGNCKQALYFYKRFKSLKEKDEKAPLSPKKREEVDRFIKELAECTAKADKSAGTQPDSIDKPPPGSTGTPTTGTGTVTTGTTTNPTGTGTVTTGTTTTGTGAVTTGTATTPATTGPTTAALESPDGSPVDDGGSVTATTEGGPKVVSVRMTFGVALISSRDLVIPAQPSIGLSGGYPLPLGKVTLELGAGFSWTPLPYENAMGQQQGRMLGLRAIAAAVFPIASKLSGRAELGLGMLSLGGLGEGNPIADMRQAASFTLPNVRLGLSADYAITPNVVAYVSPFAIGFSPGNDAMYGGGLREINVLAGVGYRQ